MGSKRTKEDDVLKISTSVFVTNFPEQASAKDLWNACKQYGHVVDAFIPNKRSKAGLRVLLAVDEEENPKSKDGVVSSEQNGKQSEDPFNIYSLLNKDKMKNNKEASTKESLEYPPGFTPRENDVENVEMDNQKDNCDGEFGNVNNISDEALNRALLLNGFGGLQLKDLVFGLGLLKLILTKMGKNGRDSEKAWQCADTYFGRILWHGGHWLLKNKISGFMRGGK
ncbi:nucleotide-binding alpha-beta plait domain-containing protein [Tanacetum coccineum]